MMYCEGSGKITDCWNINFCWAVNACTPVNTNCNNLVALWPQEIYPGQFKPSLCHRFIKQLESNGQLLKNYSQNIDTLEQVAGITRVIQCHG